MNKDDAVQWFRRHLSYDGDSDKTCPHCNKVIKEGRHWLYHYESMAHNFARQMGFKEGTPNYDAIEEIISDIAHDFDITGVKQKDSVLIVCRIWTRIYNPITHNS